MLPPPTHDGAEARALFARIAGAYVVTLADGLPRIEGRHGAIEYAGQEIATVFTNSSRTFAALLAAGAKRRHRTSESGHRLTIRATCESVATFGQIIGASLKPRKAA